MLTNENGFIRSCICGCVLLLACFLVANILPYNKDSTGSQCSTKMAGNNFKITYFNITALGEPLRFILAYAGKEFQDVRIEKSDWPAVKPTTPYGKVPIVEVDGKVLHQTKPIVRWVAKTVGLGGDNDWEDLQIGIAADTVDDIRMPLVGYFYEPHEGAKAAKLEPLLKEVLPFGLERLDAQVKANGGYLANGKLSWADLYFASLVQYLSFMAGTDNIVAKYPNLQALHDKVFALPKIAAYVAKRPQTIM